MSNVFDLMGAARRGGNLRGLGVAPGSEWTFQQRLDAAGEVQRRWVENLGRDALAALPIDPSTVEMATEIITRLDFSSADAFIDSLQVVAEQFGMYGKAAAEAMEWIQKATHWLVDTAPAFTIQVQQQHFAFASRIIAQRALGYAGDKANLLAAAQGWCFFFAPVNVSWGPGYVDRWSATDMLSSVIVNSPWDLPLSSRATDVEMLKGMFNIGAAPGNRNIYPNRYPLRLSEPRITADQVRSGLSLWNSLAGGPLESVSVAADSTAWRGANIVAFSYLPIDIDPGYRTFEVRVNGFAVKLGALPQQIVNPIATYSALWMAAAAERGTDADGNLERGIHGQIMATAFGPARQAWEQWRLTRMIFENMQKNGPVSFGALAKVAGERITTDAKKPPASSSPKWSTTKKVAVVGGVAAGGTGLYFLGRSLRWWK